jgi:hypothetical protein
MRNHPEKIERLRRAWTVGPSDGESAFPRELQAKRARP